MLRDKFVALITWSNPALKDIVIARLKGRAHGVKILTSRGDWNDELARQLNSQRKKFAGKSGVGKWRFEKFTDDHLLDAKCMCTVRSMMLHILLRPTDDSIITHKP